MTTGSALGRGPTAAGLRSAGHVHRGLMGESSDEATARGGGPRGSGRAGVRSCWLLPLARGAPDMDASVAFLIFFRASCEPAVQAAWLRAAGAMRRSGGQCARPERAGRTTGSAGRLRPRSSRSPQHQPGRLCQRSATCPGSTGTGPTAARTRRRCLATFRPAGPDAARVDVRTGRARFLRPAAALSVHVPVRPAVSAGVRRVRPMQNPGATSRTSSAARPVPSWGRRSDTRVPTCPDWTADDLLWHLAEVQWFWGEIVRSRNTVGPGGPTRSPPALTTVPPSRRSTASPAAGSWRRCAAGEPGDSAWTWSSDPDRGVPWADARRTRRSYTGWTPS